MSQIRPRISRLPALSPSWTSQTTFWARHQTSRLRQTPWRNQRWKGHQPCSEARSKKIQPPPWPALVRISPQIGYCRWRRRKRSKTARNASLLATRTVCTGRSKYGTVPSCAERTTKNTLVTNLGRTALFLLYYIIPSLVYSFKLLISQTLHSKYNYNISFND